MKLIFILIYSAAVSECFADVYEAPPYVPPPPPVSQVHLADNGDGTITDGNGLMWAKLDSYADLNKCLNWYESEKYVQELTTGGYTNWRMPSTVELYGIYDDTLANIIAWDQNPDNPLRLSKLFADGAAYWYWSGEREETKLAHCCAPAFYFVKGFTNTRRLTMCANGGVRAVRKDR